MKRITVIGKTDVTINLNKIGVPIRGKSKAILNIINDDQEKELMGIVRAGLLEIIEDKPIVPVPVIVKENEVEIISVDEVAKPIVEKKKPGRPKGTKVKSVKKPSKNTFAENEQKRMSKAEAETQKMGSRVVFGTLDGAKVGHMTRSAINDMVDSEQTRASIEAMEKLEKEEKEDISLPDTIIDESKLDASEQNGRRAVVSTESGVDKVNMVNSILPESSSIRNSDPFIDHKDKEPVKKAEVINKIDSDIVDDDGLDAAFIEI